MLIFLWCKSYSPEKLITVFQNLKLLSKGVIIQVITFLKNSKEFLIVKIKSIKILILVKKTKQFEKVSFSSSR